MYKVDHEFKYLVDNCPSVSFVLREQKKEKDVIVYVLLLCGSQKRTSCNELRGKCLDGEINVLLITFQ
jgi:hypothetical protein